MVRCTGRDMHLMSMYDAHMHVGLLNTGSWSVIALAATMRNQSHNLVSQDSSDAQQQR